MSPHQVSASVSRLLSDSRTSFSLSLKFLIVVSSPARYLAHHLIFSFGSESSSHLLRELGRPLVSLSLGLDRPIFLLGHGVLMIFSSPP